MDRQQPQPEGNDFGYGYALGGRIMLSAIIVLFVVVVFMSALHLYARWYFLRLRRSRRPVLIYANSDSQQPPNTGLQREVLNSLPFYLYSSKTAELECAVCLSEFEANQVLRLLPNCHHSFHIECIDMWFYSHSTCPLCRSTVEPHPVVEQDAQASSSGVEQDESNGSSCCDATSSAGRRKTMGLRIEVGPVSDLEGQSSPGTRFLHFKRLLSMNKRSPMSSSSCPSPRACPSTSEVRDLEAGIRVATTPRL